MTDLPGIHYSDLKHMARSPAHFAYALTAERKQTVSERLGSALHSLLLGDAADVVLFPGQRRGKAWESFKSAQSPERSGVTVLNPAELVKVQGMVGSVAKHPDAARILRDQQFAEKTMQWRWLGRLCEGTPDSYSLDRLVELKTGMTTQPERFMSAAKFYGYHAQLAWYRRGLIESGFGTPASYWIVAVESAPPFPVTVFRMTDNALDLGERMCRAWMERLLVCESAGYFPAYTDAVVPFDVVEDDGFTLKIDGEEVEVD